MSRIRDVAYVVEDLDKTATFFEDYIGFTRLGQIGRAGTYPGNALNVSDGEIVLTFLCPDADVQRKPWVHGTLGPNHVGIETERAAEIQQRLQDAGVTIYADKGRQGFFKFRDPNGVEIDVAPPNSWHPRGA